MNRLLCTLVVSLGSLALLTSCVLTDPLARADSPPSGPALRADEPYIQPLPVEAANPAPPAEPASPAPRDARRAGMLIVVSIPSQRMFVFRDGREWGSSPVSTGRPGHDTPTGQFLILQKQVHHRSTLYDGAPMPYMQRLTWGGVAFHAGRVPGYPASHGCIRLPTAFARRLYAATSMASTAVIVVEQPLGSAGQALRIASAGAMPRRPVAPERSNQAALATAAPEGPVQTIQLAAASTAQNAAALWQDLRQRQPVLQRLDHQIVPATVHSAEVFRLRASGPAAHAICSELVNAGIACMRVTG